MNIELLKDAEAHEWDAFVQEQPGATFFHQIGWKTAIERAYGLKSFYYVARNGTGLTGILPMFEVRHISHGKCMVSMPFSSCAGICAKDEASRKRLLEEAAAMSRTRATKYLELRQPCSEPLTDLEANDQYVTSLLKLNADPDAVWKGLRSEIRNRVRKAGKAGIHVSVGDRELLPEFYRVYARHMRELGTPAHRRVFLQAIMDEFPKTTKLFLVKLEDETVGGMFVLLFKDTAINMWTSCLSAYGKLSPNNLLYWEAIKYAAEHGYSYFDFGRSLVDSGPFVFKQRWGTEHHPLHYQYILNDRDEVPNAAGAGKGDGLFASVWKKLPVLLTNRLGPVLRKHIP